MTKIIHSSKSENFKVPGLPYPDRFSFIEPIIFETVPTEQEIRDLLANSDGITLRNPWSLEVVNGFEQYIPTTRRRITKNIEPEKSKLIQNPDLENCPEERTILLQIQSELDAKSATIDAAIVNTGRADLGTIVNKAHTVNRIYQIGRIYGHLRQREYPILFGDLTNPQEWNNAFMRIKQTFIDFIKEIPVGERVYPIIHRKKDTSDKENETRFPQVEWLKEELGDNLIGILLYGSAARTEDPKGYSDLDNWVRVRNIRAAQEKLKGSNPFAYEGKIIHCEEGKEPKGAKHIGIHFQPESEEYTIKFIRFLHDSREFLEHTRVLEGEFPFPIVRQDEVIERGLSHAYTKLKTIAGALYWAYHSPERIQGKPALFEFIVKNLRFWEQHALNAIVEPNFRGKEEIDHILADNGIYIPKYNDDLQYIKDSLIYANVKVLELQRGLYERHRKANLEFLTDNREFKLGDPELDRWDRLSTRV